MTTVAVVVVRAVARAVTVMGGSGSGGMLAVGVAVALTVVRAVAAVITVLVAVARAVARGVVVAV